MGQDAALHMDTQIRNVLAAGATTKRYSGTTSWANLAAGTAAAGSATITDMLDCMTKLTINRAPKRNGEYVMVVPAAVARDLMNDAKFVLAGQYGTTKGLLKGEVGMFYGVRVVVQTNPWVEDGTAGAEGTNAGAGGAKDIYLSFALGTDAFGIPEMSGQSPYDPKVVISDKADKADPLNQFIIAGWKAYWVSVVLNAPWIVALRSRTSFA
jgi:N4-gp56 family major capsid protein